MLSKRELESRYKVFVEQYLTKINIEAETAASIARTLLLPAAARHLARAARRRSSSDLAGETAELVDEFVDGDRRARAANSPRTSRTTTCSTHAKYMRDEWSRRWRACAGRGRQLEQVVADDLWPLPKYSEMLFIK